MKNVLLKLETVITFPFFLLSWIVCGIGMAIVSGFLMARAESAEKDEVLDRMFSKYPRLKAKDDK